MRKGIFVVPNLIAGERTERGKLLGSASHNFLNIPDASNPPISLQKICLFIVYLIDGEERLFPQTQHCQFALKGDLIMVMTNQPDDTTQGIDFSTFTALHVGVGEMSLSGKLAANEVANISFGIDANSQYHFMKEVYYTDRVHPVGLWTPLNVEEMRALLPALKGEEKHVSPGLDPVLLRTFIHLLSQAIENQPSMRFNDPTFGSIAIVRRSLIVGHYELGPDVAGMIHDANGVVTVEQHVVAMPPGRFRHLSTADKLSLVAALEKFTTTAQPPADPLWGQVLSDLKK